MTVQRLIVKRDAIADCQLVDRPMPVAGPGEVLVRVDQFALTANNITYAVVGEMIGYWRFYPEDDQWGVVPVWGFGTVIDSHAEGVPVGTRIWGFLPMASHVVMTPGRVSARGFVDAATHRADLPAVYNQYARTNDDPAALADIADARSLLFPLLTTSWLIADYIADNGNFGAQQVIIGSASSKTGFGTAHFVRALGSGLTVAGLTSPRNIGFVEGLGVCDQVVAYDAITSLDPAVPSVYVDMSGDGAVLAAVHNHFGDNIRASIGVGVTHWEAPRNSAALPGARPAMFFAPSQIAKRDSEWGAGETMRRASVANIAFAHQLKGHVTSEHRQGGAAVADSYREMARGETRPETGLILAF